MSTDPLPFPEAPGGLRVADDLLPGSGGKFRRLIHLTEGPSMRRDDVRRESISVHTGRWRLPGDGHLRNPCLALSSSCLMPFTQVPPREARLSSSRGSGSFSGGVRAPPSQVRCRPGYPRRNNLDSMGFGMRLLSTGTRHSLESRAYPSPISPTLQTFPGLVI